MYLVAIYPLGYLTLVRNDKMHLADKRHILSYASEEVAQSAPITKALLQDWLIGVLLVVALPNRIQSIYVCYNNIHVLTIYTNGGRIFPHYKGSAFNWFSKEINSKTRA